MAKDKQTYKEKNGTTRIGDFLRDAKSIGKEIAPGLLDIAGAITGRDGLTELADKIRGNQIKLAAEDKEVTLKLIEQDIEDTREETKRILAKYEAETAGEQEVTKRWQSDMGSDNMLSKSTRPILVLGITFTYLVSFIIDSIDTIRFAIPPIHEGIMIAILLTALGGFFTIRTIEKYHNKKYSK